MRVWSLFILITLSLFGHHLTAQVTNSFEHPYEICSKGSYGVFYKKEKKTISSTTNGQGVFCSVKTEDAFWISFEVAEEGYLTFTLKPKTNILDDIDFGVYLVQSIKGRQKKKLVRCMNSGANMFSDSLISHCSIPCIGATGLSVTEKGNKRESAGCDAGDDNFLSPLKCQKGDIYMLAVSSFGDKNHDFILDLCGSAMLSCDTVNCGEITPDDKFLPTKQEVIFPTQAHHGVLPIIFDHINAKSVKLHLRHFETEEEYSFFLKLEKGKKSYDFSVANLPIGKYEIDVIVGEKVVKGHFKK